MRTRRRVALVLALIPTLSCSPRAVVQGTVTAFEDGAPLAGATVTAVQHGWGFSNGTLVWDKDKSVSVTTDASGDFAVSVRAGSSVKLRVRHPGYQRFETWYERGAQPGIRLKERIDVPRVVPTGSLRLGLRDDGSTYGWSFARGEVAASDTAADVLPVSVSPEPRGVITLRATGRGGIRFVPKSELGVDDLFLVYTDEAPEDGYSDTATIDFSSEGGVYFVRTRDGAHYAKFVFTPSAFAMMPGPGIVRDLTLQYVYNPDGSRNLLYQMPE